LEINFTNKKMRSFPSIKKDIKKFIIIGFIAISCLSLINAQTITQINPYERYSNSLKLGD